MLFYRNYSAKQLLNRWLSSAAECLVVEGWCGFVQIKCDGWETCKCVNEELSQHQDFVMVVDG